MIFMLLRILDMVFLTLFIMSFTSASLDGLEKKLVL